jgi:glycosyltransferase involved in cell wall biosynthesis
MEAMATGLPIVTTANSGTIVREGVDGFIRPYDRPDELAECVDRLIGDETLRLRTGRNARNRVEANDIDAYSLRIAALINQLVNGAEETAGISA